MAAKKKSAKKAAKPAKKSAKPASKGAKKPAKKAGKPAKKKVSWLPKGYTVVSPGMNQADASATIEFIKNVFGAKERARMPGPNGKIMHCELVIGDSTIMLSDAVMEPARISSTFLYVPDVDKTLAVAISEGSTVRMAATDMFWGDRFARFTDPFGNLWAISTHIEDVTPKEMKKRAAVEMQRMAASMGGGNNGASASEREPMSDEMMS